MKNQIPISLRDIIDPELLAAMDNQEQEVVQDFEQELQALQDKFNKIVDRGLEVNLRSEFSSLDPNISPTAQSCKFFLKNKADPIHILMSRDTTVKVVVVSHQHNITRRDSYTRPTR